MFIIPSSKGSVMACIVLSIHWHLPDTSFVKEVMIMVWIQKVLNILLKESQFHWNSLMGYCDILLWWACSLAGFPALSRTSLTYTDCGCSTNAGSVSKPLCCPHSSSDYVDSLSSFLPLSPSVRLNILLRLRAMCALVVVKVGVPTVNPVVFLWIFPFLSSNWKLEFSCFPSFFYPA